MPCKPPHPLFPILALIALILLTPTLATALPQDATTRSAAECTEIAPNLFAKLWTLLSAVWTTGSILEPDGASATPEPGNNSDAAIGDAGSILEPNG